MTMKNVKMTAVRKGLEHFGLHISFWILAYAFCICGVI